MTLLAIPQQHIEWFHPVGPVPTPPPYQAAVTWWTWECDCGERSKPGNLWSHAESALEMGEYHQAKAQCQRLGQLELFTLAAAA